MAEKKDSPLDNDSDLKKKLETLERKSGERREITRSKRLKELQNKLEGSHKVERVKNLKRKLLIPQILGIIILFPFLIYINEASFNPLYLPIYHSVLMLFGWMLIIFIASFIFRILRIKRHKSYSIKYLLARNSMRKSVSVAVVALLIFGALYTPYLTEVINDFSSVENEPIELASVDDSGIFEAEIELHNRGILGLRRLKNLTVESTGDTSNSWLNITLYEKHENKREGVYRNRSANEYKETFDAIDMSTFKEFILHVSSNEDISLQYSFRMEVSPSQQTSFSLLSFLYMGVFIQTAVIFYPIKKKYSGEGIYL